jgi:phospholipid/cholesterol/gamma-HCH transport system substrate-binding protein
MLKHFKGARLGLFVFLGTSFLVLSIFLIGNRESMFIQTIKIKTFFESVEGLRNGAPVWLSGYDIGNVESISLAPDTSGRVEVIMSIDQDLRHFIRIDSEASIETAGLVGKKIVSIIPGSPDKAVVSDGGTIKSKDPINVSEIIQDSRAVIKNLEIISREFAGISEKVNSGSGTVGMLIHDEELYSSTVDVTKSAAKSLTEVNTWFVQIRDFTDTLNTGIKSISLNVDAAITDLRALISDIKSGEGIVGRVISDPATYDSAMVLMNNLIETTKAAKIGAVRLAENMEALKHNWLFKGYFENRGYWDVSEFSKEIDKKLAEFEVQKKLMYKKLQELDQLKAELKKEQSDK